MSKTKAPTTPLRSKPDTFPKPTLKTVAEAAGLAVTTVSRALAGDPLISLATRERVRAIAAELGYVPDRAAQRLKTGRTNVIGVLLDPHEEILGFGTSLLYGVTKALQGTPYHLIVMPNFLDTSSIEAVEHIVRNNLADGLIFTRTETLDPRVRLLTERDFPFVSHGRTEFATPHAFVDYDNYAFAYEAARRLIAKGRQKLTIILPPRHLTFSQHMLHGFMTAVREAGIAFELAEGVNHDSKAALVREYFRQRLTRPDPPDALICPGEVSAMAAITGMNDGGWSLGTDYDIVAKQTSQLLADIRPGVDTIYEDLTAAGEHLAKLLLRRIAGADVQGLQTILS